jgi:ABC-type amino acid transport substrate-binding protein
VAATSTLRCIRYLTSKEEKWPLARRNRLLPWPSLSALLRLAPCADPGATAATAPTSGSSTTAAGKTFNLSPEQDRFKVSVDSGAAVLVPDAIKADGKLTVVSTGGTAPLSTFATDNKTLIGSEVDLIRPFHPPWKVRSRLVWQ